MCDNLYCKAFLNTTKSRDELIPLLEGKLNRKLIHLDFIYTDWGFVVIQENDDADPKKVDLPLDDFLYWPYFLDIDVEQPLKVDQSSYITHVVDLIRFLNSHGIEVVPACEFEDEIHEQLDRG